MKNPANHILDIRIIASSNCPSLAYTVCMAGVLGKICY